MDSDDYQHELYTSTRPQQTSLFRWKTSDLKLDPGDRLVGRGRHRARIYDFFVLFITKDGELLGKCRICEIGKPPVAYSCRTYSNLESHLFRKKGEKLHAMGLEMHIADKKDRKRKKFPESGSLNSVCPPRNTMENLMDGELGQRAFEYGLTLLLATLNLPLNISREKAFRLFLKFCGCSYTIPNHYTIRHRLSEMAVTIREKLSTQMRMAKLSSGGMPYLHLTSDAWTAKYTMQNFATVTAHYVTGDFKIESRVVAARPSRGRKTQTQIALWLSAALRKECEIDMGDIATITTDGAADFRAAVKNQTGKEGIHCCAHRLDLALSFGMCCGDKRSKYPTEIRSIYESARAQAVVFTTSSAKAKELLDHCSNGSELKMFTDINVRWCSSFNMYVRILRLKEALDRYYQEKRTDRPFEHFETLAQIIGVVRPFSEVLKRIQSPTVSIGHAYYLILDAFTMMDTLDIPTTEDPGKYKQMQSEELNKTARMVWERIRQQIQSRFFSDKHVLQKHFLMSYYLDVVFRFSLRVLQECRVESHLSSEDEELLLKKAREYVKREMDGPEIEDIVEESPAKRLKSAARVNQKMEKAWARERKLQSGISVLDDQLNKYETVMLPIDASSLEWWATSGNSICKGLVPVARRVLALQATSCASERTFSSLRRILRWDRTSLDGETVMQLSIIRNNWDVIENLDDVLHLSESEARARGVFRDLGLTEPFEEDELENSTILEK